MKKVQTPTVNLSDKSGGGSVQDADYVPTLTKSARYEFSSKLKGSDTGKIDPSKHTKQQ